MTSTNRRRGPALSLTPGLQSCSLQQCVLVLYGAYFTTSAICIVGMVLITVTAALLRPAWAYMG